jgi:hypothetical protein
MNISRGLFRIWIVLAAGWIMVVGYADDLPCAFGVTFSAPWCVGYAHDPYAWQSAWPIHVLVFAVPIAALAVGTALTWAINGFRMSGSN